MIIKIKRLFKIFASLLLSVYTTTLAKGHYGWCSPYDTFCLFSEGVETKVSNLSEAQFKCSEIKNDSWPVELGDERVKEVFIEFIHNYSISNVILNADNRNGAWYWKRSNKSVATNVTIGKENDIILFYKDSDSIPVRTRYYSNYSVVCMTNCKGNWSFENQTGYNPDQALEASHDMSIKSLEECKEICESSVKCSSVDWTYESTFHGCWMQKYPYDINKRDTKNGTSHHALDRSIKTIDRCVGEAFMHSSKSTQDQSPKVYQFKAISAKLVEILVPIVLIVSILVIVILIIIHYKRKIKKAETSEDFGVNKENVGNSQQDGNQTPKEKINTYENTEEINKEPNRYPGPRGDQYTEVDIDDKQSSADRTYKTTENILNSQSQQEESKTSHNKIHTYDDAKYINEEPNRYPGPRGDQYTEVDVDGKQSSADGRVN